MRKRLHARLDEADFLALQRMAETHGMTLSAWVRNTLRMVRKLVPLGDVV